MSQYRVTPPSYYIFNMLKIPRKKNGKTRRDERVDEDIRVQEYGDCSRNEKEEAEKKR